MTHLGREGGREGGRVRMEGYGRLALTHICMKEGERIMEDKQDRNMEGGRERGSQKAYLDQKSKSVYVHD